MLTNELQVGVVKYRAPTTPREEFEQTGDGGGGVKKFDFDIVIERTKFIKETEVLKIDSLGGLTRDRTTREPLYLKWAIKKWFQV